MRFASIVGLGLGLGLVLVCAGCDTKRKLDRTLDNANDTITKANMKLDELSALAAELKSDLSAAVKQTGDAASKTVASLGDLGGNVPESGGEVKAPDESTDIDEDGETDSITAVEYDDRILWLAEASTFASFSCETLLYYVTDKPPEEILAWGLIAEGCGAMACPTSELEEEEPDFDTCECEDAEGGSTTCTALFQTLGGQASGEAGASGGSAGEDGSGAAGSGSEQVCPEGTEGTPPDCTEVGGSTESGWSCLSGDGVVPPSYLCDGEDDCTDGSDEACGVVVACQNQEVVTPDSVCDGTSDCSDDSDELACLDGSYVCASGDEMVSASALCDGTPDCGDQSDEDVCNVVWVCDDQSGVLLPSGVCDGSEDCGDGSDEARCQAASAGGT